MNMAAKTSNRGGREFVGVLLRLPPDVANHIDRAAEAAYRTRTAEILQRLRESMSGEVFDEHGVIVRRDPVAHHRVDELREGGQ